MISGHHSPAQIAVVVCLFVLIGAVALLVGRRMGRRALSQRIAALTARLGLEAQIEDSTNIESALSKLEQVTGEAHRAVNESSADAIRLRRSLDALHQGVVLCDENGAVIYRNGEASALMTSRYGDALAAQAVTELLEDAWDEGAAERTLELYGPPRRTLVVRAKQIDDGRRPLGVIAMIDDISERRRLEEVRRDFVANVSHELKTPMGALGLLAETLISEPDVEIAKRMAERIHLEAFRVSRIIDDLLDLSRIESEEAPPRELVLVNLVMAQAAERVRASAEHRHIEIAMLEPDPPVAVLGDRRQLVSAMHALLENAVTYSYDGAAISISGAVRKELPDEFSSHPSAQGMAGGTSASTPTTAARPLHRTTTLDLPNAGDPSGKGTVGALPETLTEMPAGWNVTDPTSPGAGTPTPTIGFSPEGQPPSVGQTPNGGVQSPEDDPGFRSTALDDRPSMRECVRLSVTDRGIGIPSRDLDRIFERFYRVDHGRSRETGGTGLGLSIARHVARNHQGWIEVESREGEGSTFTLVLPVQTELTS